MNKWYNRNNKSEGNRWMLLGSRFSKVLNPIAFNIEPGTVVKMSRHDYRVEPDGSVRRVTGKRRTRKRPGIIL
jgi:hypothetical protein